MNDFAAFVFALVAGGFGAGIFVGYKYRDFVGKESLRSLRLISRLNTPRPRRKLKPVLVTCKKAYEVAKADAEKAGADLANAAASAKAKLEEIKKL